MTGEEAGITGWLIDFRSSAMMRPRSWPASATGSPRQACRCCASRPASEAFHPTLDARTRRWSRGRGVELEEITRERAEAGEEEWRQSPFYQLVEAGANELRRRLGDNYEQGEFPLLDRFVRDHGMTDYLALAVRYGPGSTLGVVPGLVISYQTDRRGGFEDAEVALLRRLTRPFALAYKAIASVHTGRSLLETYLGGGPGAARARWGHRPRQGRAGRGRALVQRPPGLHPDRRHRSPRPGAGVCSTATPTAWSARSPRTGARC